MIKNNNIKTREENKAADEMLKTYLKNNNINQVKTRIKNEDLIHLSDNEIKQCIKLNESVIKPFTSDYLTTACSITGAGP